MNKDGDILAAIKFLIAELQKTEDGRRTLKRYDIIRGTDRILATTRCPARVAYEVL